MCYAELANQALPDGYWVAEQRPHNDLKGAPALVEAARPPEPKPATKQLSSTSFELSPTGTPMHPKTQLQWQYYTGFAQALVMVSSLAYH